MPSITSWTRLEPHTRNNEMNTGLQARIYDPLWMLARQWQVGEFQGEDNGSPVMARLRAESAKLSRYQPGPIEIGAVVEGQKYDGAKQPLETLVERERVHQEGQPERLLLAVEAGLHFLRLLKQKQLTRDYRDGYLKKYSFTPLTLGQRNKLDSASLKSFDLLAPRSIDGAKLHHELSRAPRMSESGLLQLPADPPIDPADLAEVREAVEIWLRWYAGLFNEPPAANPSWLPERMEYAFSTSARTGAGERILFAGEYYDGRLDWYAFNMIGIGSLGVMSDAAPTQITRTTIPAPVTYRGMPSPRWWELEDAQVDFGAIDAGPEDLARMLLIEFAMSYGNDWFVIPVDVPVGSLCQVRSLIVTDTFGFRTLIQPAAGGASAKWRMFQLTGIRQEGVFFLPPALLKNMESEPFEDVLFLRDEMANMAWAVERIIESPAGRPFNRKDNEYVAEPDSKSLASGALAYRLASIVPDYWIPLIPVKIDPNKPDIQLQRGVMLSRDENQPPDTLAAKGRILTPHPGQRLKIFEEEVPREGIRVTRTYQHTRWLDGSTLLWIGRRKQVGRGEGSSGLKFDQAK